jgi:hypothetical protein
MGSPPVFGGVCGAAHRFSFLCCGFFFSLFSSCVLCTQWYCSFLMISSIFPNIYASNNHVNLNQHMSIIDANLSVKMYHKSI